MPNKFLIYFIAVLGAFYAGYNYHSLKSDSNLLAQLNSIISENQNVNKSNFDNAVKLENIKEQLQELRVDFNKELQNEKNDTNFNNNCFTDNYIRLWNSKLQQYENTISSQLNDGVQN